MVFNATFKNISVIGVLACSPGKVLNITFAKYEGRSRLCSRHEVTSIVQRQCQKKRTCTVFAEDEYYEDSCFMANEVLREYENVPFVFSCPLYTGSNYMHYLLMEEMRLPFIDSDLLYRG
jgi:hypothetical protein